MSAADWKCGDLALCIREWECRCGHPQCQDARPRKEEILRVVGTSLFKRHLYLGFEGKPGNMFWDHLGFRKITPDNRAADDDAWVEQLQHFRRGLPA